MIHTKKPRIASVAAALLVGLASLSTAQPARASSSYPPEVQAALSAQFGKAYCVPQCILCHQTNLGGLKTLNVFGNSLSLKGGLPFGSPQLVAGAFANYKEKQSNADSDGDGLSDETELEMGSSPSIALPRGEGLICPDIKYGCGARIAAAPPPVDHVGLFSAGLVALGLTVLRRRLRTPRPS